MLYVSLKITILCNCTQNLLRSNGLPAVCFQRLSGASTVICSPQMREHTHHNCFTSFKKQGERTFILRLSGFPWHRNTGWFFYFFLFFYTWEFVCDQIRWCEHNSAKRLLSGLLLLCFRFHPISSIFDGFFPANMVTFQERKSKFMWVTRALTGTFIIVFFFMVKAHL